MISGQVEERSRKRINPQIAKKADRLETTRPKNRMSQPWVGSPTLCSSQISLRPASRDRGNAEQEGKPCRLGPGEAQPHRRRQRRAGARDAGDERGHLRDAHEQRIDGGHLIERALLARRAVHEPEEHAHGDERDGDEPGDRNASHHRARRPRRDRPQHDRVRVRRAAAHRGLRGAVPRGPPCPAST